MATCERSNVVSMQGAQVVSHILLSQSKLRENQKILWGLEAKLAKQGNCHKEEATHCESNIALTEATTEYGRIGSEPLIEQTIVSEDKLEGSGKINTVRESQPDTVEQVASSANIMSFVDTSNDGAIAELLQNELHMSIADDQTQMMEQDDYVIALSVQETLDEETSHHTSLDRARYPNIRPVHQPQARRSLHTTYEDMSELEDVPCGYTLREITRLTTTHKYYNETEAVQRCCVVCMADYSVGQVLRLLPCQHSFHRYCIDKWLGSRKSCPVCLKPLH